MAKLKDLEIGDIVRIIKSSHTVTPSHRCLRITALHPESKSADVRAEFLGWESGVEPDEFIVRWTRNLQLNSSDLEKIA